MRERRSEIFVQAIDAAAEPACRQHDATSGRDLFALAFDQEHTAADPAAGYGELFQASVAPDRHAVLHEAEEEPRDERIPHEEARAAAIAQAIAGLPP